LYIPLRTYEYACGCDYVLNMGVLGARIREGGVVDGDEAILRAVNASRRVEVLKINVHSISHTLPDNYNKIEM
jgi:hypothetical protein